jgi:hypothetical protein
MATAPAAVQTTTIEELKATYRTEKHSLLGECVIIPIKDCDPSLEADFRKQGHRVLHESSRGVMSTFISVNKKGDLNAPRVVFKPNRSPAPVPLPRPRKFQFRQHEPTREDIAKSVRARATGGNMRKNVWKAEEDELLIKLWNNKLKTPQIAEEFRSKFPNRTAYAVANHLTALQNEGRIEPRWRIQKWKKAKTAITGQRFTKTEDDQLIELWNKKPRLSLEEIALRLPARSKKAVTKRLKRLKAEGKIQPRYKTYTTHTKATEKPPREDVKTVTSEPVLDQLEDTAENTEESLNKQLQIAIIERDLLKELLTNAVAMNNDKLDSYITMHALEIKEREDPDFTIPQNIINLYMEAQLRNDADLRRQFKEKVRLLIEVYS